VRLEDKQVDGPDLERDEQRKQSLLAESEESELAELAEEQVRDPERDRSIDLLASIRLILENKHLDVSHLGLPQRDALALEALQSAVTGRNTNLGTFIYAEDRRSMLEQALAVLQPGLTGGAQEQLAAMNDFQILNKHVNELRDSLLNLEDGQDELFASDHRRSTVQAGDGETADKPKPKPSDPDAPRPATTLTGPEVAQEPRTTTLSTGPEAKLERAPTTLTGPEPKQESKSSMLSTGPEAKLERLPSTLAGPERKEQPEAPTTLGSPDEIEQAAKKKPWWRKPFG
jgi:hypothetical protein